MKQDNKIEVILTKEQLDFLKEREEPLDWMISRAIELFIKECRDTDELHKVYAAQSIIDRI